jgi:hypothetical protein
MLAIVHRGFLFIFPTSTITNFKDLHVIRITLHTLVNGKKIAKRFTQTLGGILSHIRNAAGREHKRKKLRT